MPRHRAGETDLCVVLSDLHIGKMTGGGFCLDVARERLAGLPEKIASHPCIPRGFNRIVLMVVGDIVDGEGIYDGQAKSQDKSGGLEQAEIATDLLWHVALRLSKEFRTQTSGKYHERHVHIVGVPGNHGMVNRVASRMSNWDNAVLMRLADRASRHGRRMSASISTGSFQRIDVQGHGVLLNHKGVKHLGTPAMLTKFHRWMAHHDCSILVHGHWHHAELTPSDRGYRIANGSLVGVDDLADDMACFDPPRQVWFAVDRSRGIVGYNWIQW